MLTSIAVRNFQSLKQVDLDLGAFTVIVGPSSSGKSALMRAFRAVASNVRGAGVITRGQKQMAITYATDRWTVTLERTDKAGLYRLADAAGEISFTKLNGEVPPQVTAALRLEPVTGTGMSVNFSSQFDRPFLLDESGATVARVLGELTNVNAIFEAVRGANKIRLAAAGTLKTRKADLEALTGRLGDFLGLTERLAALGEVEKLHEDLSALHTRTARLELAIRQLRMAERAIEKTVLPPVPPVEQLSAAWVRYLDLHAATALVATRQLALRTAQKTVQSTTEQEATTGQQLTDLLAQAGVCPTCGQAV